MKGFDEIWQAWQKFWFKPQDLINVSLFRFLLAITMLIMYSIRAIDLDLFFYNGGLLPAEVIPDFLPETRKPLFYWFPITDQGILILHSLFLVGLLALALGLIGQYLTWGLLILHLAFLQRNPTVVYGADLMNSFWLFYLGFISHNKYFSLKSWLKNKSFRIPSNQSIRSDLLGSMGIRLIQIQLCVTYGITGWEKLKGSQWWEGSAIWYVLSNDQLVFFDFSFLYYVPWLVGLITYATLIFEIYFPVMIWVKPVRNYWLWIGFFFHLGIGISMGLYFFSAVMTLSYLVFISADQLRNWLVQKPS